MTQAYPLAWPEGWPRTPQSRQMAWRHAQKPFDSARKELQRQVEMLGGRALVISSNLPLRLDGMPRADVARMRIEDPGVAIYFQLRQRQMVIARDVYLTVADNLNSLRLAVEYMRGLERHGGAHMMERAFAGFTALPPPSGGAQPQESPVIWRQELDLRELPDGLPKRHLLVIAEQAYRDLAKQHHADHGGDGTKMIRLNAAIAQARQELKE